MQPTEFALIVAAARKEVERVLQSKDRAALEAFAPSFAIKDGHLFMSHSGGVADLGDIVGPPGKDGFHGRDGKSIKGDKGEPGRDGVDGKSIEGPRGERGEKGEPGQDGQPGADGVGVATAYVSDTGYLIIELTDGRKITAGYVRGKDGKSGQGAVFWGAGGTGGGGGGGGATDLAWDAATSTVTSSTGTDAILTLADAVNAGLLSAADKIKLDGITSASGSAVLDFGVAPGTNTAETVVTTAIPSGAVVRAWFQSEGNADHNEIEHRLIFPSRVGLTCGAIVAGVSFTIYAETELRLTGDVTCRWQWSN